MTTLEATSRPAAAAPPPRWPRWCTRWPLLIGSPEDVQLAEEFYAARRA